MLTNASHYPTLGQRSRAGSTIADQIVSCVPEVTHTDLFIDDSQVGIDVKDTESVICVWHTRFSNSAATARYPLANMHAGWVPMVQNSLHTTDPPIRQLNIRMHRPIACTNGKPVHVLDHSSLRVDATAFAKVPLVKIAIAAKVYTIWGGYGGSVLGYRGVVGRLCETDSCNGGGY